MAPTGRVTTGEAPPIEGEIALDDNHDLALLDRIGPSVVIVHSQSGTYGLDLGFEF